MNAAAAGSRPPIVVVGAGFAGLNVCRKIPSDGARITVIDRENHGLFQPLPDQVATAGLSARDIAQPVGARFGARPNLTVLLGAVTGFDLAKRVVGHERGEMNGDFRRVAAGGVTRCFGHAAGEAFAPGLESRNEAWRIRRQTVCLVERAETETDAARCDGAMTIVVIGGGPRGVEQGGVFAELTRTVLHGGVDHIDPTKARVLLIAGAAGARRTCAGPVEGWAVAASGVGG